MRNFIHNVVQVAGMMYLVAAFFLVPILAYVLWKLGFDPRTDKIGAIAIASKIGLGLLIGYVLLKMWVEAGRVALMSKIRSVAPRGFRPPFELHGCGVTEYIGMAPNENVLVVVDMKRGIARCESMNFYQGWDLEENGSVTFLTIRFNSFDFPFIKVQIPRKRKDEIIAKLNYAMKF